MTMRCTAPSCCAHPVEATSSRPRAHPVVRKTVLIDAPSFAASVGTGYDGPARRCGCRPAARRRAPSVPRTSTDRAIITLQRRCHKRRLSAVAASVPLAGFLPQARKRDACGYDRRQAVPRITLSPAAGGSRRREARMPQANLQRPVLLSILAALLTLGLKVAAWRVTGSVGLLADALETITN